MDQLTSTDEKSVQVPKVSIDWYRSTPWWRLISHTLGISWRASHLALCAVALLATQGLTSISEWLFAPESLASSPAWVQPNSNAPAMTPWSLSPEQWLNAYEGRNLEKSMAADPISEAGATTQRDSLRRLVWFHPAPDSFLQVWRRYVSYPYHAMDGLSLRRLAAFLCNTLVVIGIWAFVGGCIARRSVQELGMHITSPWIDTIRLVRSRWLSIIWSVSMPIVLVLFICLIPLLLGLLSNIPWVGPFVAYLLMIPIVILGLGLGWAAAISIFGFPIATVAIVTEKQADAFDGMSRANAYIFQRPATLFLAVAAADWLGHFAGSMLSIVFNTGFNAIAQSFAISSIAPLGQFGGWLDPCFRGLVPLIVTSYGFSFFWTASTAIYLILRKEIDHSEFDSVDMGNQAIPKTLPKIPSAPE